MPLDASIFSQIRTPQIDPNQWQANALKLSALRDSNALARLQLQQTQRGIEDENALRDLSRQAGGDQGRLRDLLARGGYFKQVQTLDETVGKQKKLAAETGKIEADTGKAKAETFLKQLEGRRDALATVSDQNGYNAWRESMMQQYGPDVLRGVPDVYSPDWQRQSIMTADKTIEDAWKQSGFRRDDARIAEAGRHNRAAEGLTRRGQDLTNSRSIESNSIAREKIGAAKSGDQVAAATALENSAANLDRLVMEAKAIQSDPALGRITGVPGALPSIPGGAAADVEARLAALKSQVAFSVLQAMRDASKTGGALGQVSERELDLLSNNLAALDTKQSPEAFKKNLQQVIDYAAGVKGRMQNAFAQQYGGAPQSAPAAPSAAPSGGVKFLGFE